MILVIVELLPHKTSRDAYKHPRWIPISRLPSEYIARDLRHVKANQIDTAGIPRIADYRGCGVGISRQDLDVTIHPHSAIQFHAARARASQVQFLPCNKGGRGRKRYVCNWVDNVTPKKCVAHAQAAIPTGEIHSRLCPSEPLRAQPRIVEGKHIAHAEGAIQLVESGCPKSAVDRTRQRHMFVHGPQNRKPGA